MNTILYIASMIALFAALWQVGRAAAALRLPWVLTLSIAAALLVYLGSLLPGAAGHYTAPLAAGMLIGLSVLTFISLRRVAMQPPLPVAMDCGGPAAWRGPWNAATLILCAVALVALSPLSEKFYRLPGSLRDTDAVISYDGMTYHLPAFVDFVQHQSLWYLSGPYSSYSYGYELIYGYPMLFSKQHWTLVPAATLSTIFLLSAMSLLAVAVVRGLNGSAGSSHPSRWGSAERINPIVVALGAAGLYALRFAGITEALAKNDLFLGACLVSTLALLVESTRADLAATVEANPAIGRALKLRRRALIALAAASLGLAVATKPTALGYVAIFAVLAAVIPASGSTRHRRLGGAILRAMSLTAGALVIGGFWYVRNIIRLGHLFDPENASGLKLSLIANVRDPRLYAWHEGSALFVASVVAALLLGGLILFRWKQSKSPVILLPAILLLLFLLGAIGAFGVTPFVVFRPHLWFLRLGIALFATASVAAALVAGQIAAWRGWCGQSREPEVSVCPSDQAIAVNADQDGLSPTPDRTLPGVGGMLLALAGVGLAVLLPMQWARHVPPGLPGYDKVKSLPPTGVYDWVREQPGARRIYSAGLRPYGLVGREWQNEIFYDMHSYALGDRKPVRTSADPLFIDYHREILDTGIPTGPARLLAVLQTFHPEWLAISVEPDDNEDPPTKPIHGWLETQPWLHKIYEDPTATVYEIKDGWQALLPEYPQSAKPVRAGR